MPAFALEMRLHLAAADGDTAMLKRLLARTTYKIDSACTGDIEDGGRPVLGCAEESSSDGANDKVDDAAGSFTCPTLVAASYHGHQAAARVLLDNGDDLNLVTSDGQTALMAAARRGHLQVLQLLVTRGADLSKIQPGSRMSALHFAAENDQPGCCEALLRAGADPTLRAARGRTPAAVAAATGSAAAANVLRTVEAELHLARAQATNGNQATGTKSLPPELLRAKLKLAKHRTGGSRHAYCFCIDVSVTMQKLRYARVVRCAADSG
eukprot:SAG31_NODE_8374_length_1464_cov_0.980220_1_plen_267_part_00